MIIKLRAWLLNLSMTKKILLLSAVLLPLAGIGCTAWYYSRLSNTSLMFPDVNFPDPGDNNGPVAKDVNEVFSGDILNILLMGFDSNAERKAENDPINVDTIMVAAINLKTGKVDIVSIPRDTLVPIYKSGNKGKINSAYGYGYLYGGADPGDYAERHRLGIEYQVNTISMALKEIPIHYYVSIDMDGVLEAVDILGGVWYDVETTVYHKSGRVIAKPGYQLLKGKKLMDFLRSREYARGDFKRVETQQSVMLAAFDQFKRADKLIHVPQVYAAMKDEIETNLSLEQIMSLALFAGKKVSLENISTHTLKVDSILGRLKESWTQSYWYAIIRQQERADLIFEIWGKKVKVDSPEVIYEPLPEEDESDWGSSNQSPSTGYGPGMEQPPAEPGDGSGDQVPPEEPGDGSSDPIPEPGSETGSGEGSGE